VAAERPAVDLLAVGIDHTTAPVELRERLAFADGDIPVALRRLAGAGEPRQAAIVATCSRVELYAIMPRFGAQAELAAFLARHHGLEERELAGSLYALHGDDVAHHLAATAAGMNSLVLGEAQVQGQVRAAMEIAAAAGTAGPELRRLFEAALVAGRRVRAETSLGRGIASISHAGAELARRRLGDLEGATAVLIGSGEVSELAAKHLVAQGAGRLVVVGRNLDRALQVAQRHGADACDLPRLPEVLCEADVVIGSSASAEPVLGAGLVERAVQARAGRPRPLLLIDLAVPRDVDPAAGALDGVELFTIDDLRGVVEQTLSRRAAELPAAYAIIHREVRRFTSWMSRRQAFAAQRSLRREAESLRAGELAEVAARLAALPAGDREAVEAMTSRLVVTLVDATGAALRHAAAADHTTPWGVVPQPDAIGASG
jgi:glutamyl-tRNA reductase